MTKQLLTSAIIITALSLGSCGGEKYEEFNLDEGNVSTIRESNFDAQKVFNTLPSRQLILSLIEDNRLEYNPDLLNDPNNVSKYSVEFLRALNLGAYGSNVIIASSFDQNQESMVFLKCVNALANHLGVGGVFDQKFIDRIEANNDRKDSVLQIVTGAFQKLDEVLKKNHRPATSATILAGCWIEGMYVSCQIANAAKSEAVIKNIVLQKESLENLIGMLESVQLESYAKFILSDLKHLQKAFVEAEFSDKWDVKAIEKITVAITELRTKVVNSTTIATGGKA